MLEIQDVEDIQTPLFENLLLLGILLGQIYSLYRGYALLPEPHL